MINDQQIAKRYISKVKDAEKRGLEFSLPFKEFKQLFRRKNCPLLGITMSDDHLANADGIIKDNYRTFDRIDNKLGYISGNVVCVSHKGNQLKSVIEAKKVELGNVAKYMIKKGVL